MSNVISEIRIKARGWPAQTKAVLILALIWVSRGLVTALTADVVDPGQPHQMVPIAVRATLWIVCGLLSVWFVYRGKQHAFSVLMVMPAAMFVSYVIDAIMYLIPPDPPGSLIAFPSLGYYGGYVILLWLMGRLWPTRQRDQEDHAKLAV